MPMRMLLALCAALVLASGCSINVQTFRDFDEPYAEAVLSGAARGKVSLYKKHECIEKNVPAEDAVEKLIDLIKLNGDWREPES